MLLSQVRVMVLMTSHNRKEQTLKCIRSLRSDPGIDLRFVVVDAGSTDGSREALSAEKDTTLILRGDDLFWNGGMRVAMSYAAKCGAGATHVFLVNDDVEFFSGALRSLLARMGDAEGAEDPGSGEKVRDDIDAVVGATKNAAGEQTYGGVRMSSAYLARYELIPPSEQPEACDTFNCNALLMRYASFIKAGNLDAAYVHSMGDYDYGMKLRRLQMHVINSAAYVGLCEGNAKEGSWLDPSLPRRERLRKKESEKGLPRRDWYHFVRKNYSLPAAVYHSMTPYVKILLGIG